MCPLFLDMEDWAGTQQNSNFPPGPYNPVKAGSLLPVSFSDEETEETLGQMATGSFDASYIWVGI
jgi:hypothetical protein